jgi:hypothetical protein
VPLLLQPAIYVASLAAVEKLRGTEGQALLDSVDVTGGLSLGEYTALAFAGERLASSSSSSSVLHCRLCSCLVMLPAASGLGCTQHWPSLVRGWLAAAAAAKRCRFCSCLVMLPAASTWASAQHWLLLVRGWLAAAAVCCRFCSCFVMFFVITVLDVACGLRLAECNQVKPAAPACCNAGVSDNMPAVISEVHSIGVRRW